MKAPHIILSTATCIFLALLVTEWAQLHAQYKVEYTIASYLANVFGPSVQRALYRFFLIAAGIAIFVLSIKAHRPQKQSDL